MRRLDRRGATAVEFALIALPLLMSFIGVFEFGRLMWTRSALQGVAAEGARCMGLGLAACGAGGAYSAGATLAHVRTLAARRAIDLPAADVTLERPATCSGTPGFSRVRVATTFRGAAPLLGALAAMPVSVTACFPNQG